MTPTIFHRGLWAWLCETCGETGAGYSDEIQARVIHDEHARIHRFPEFCGGSHFGASSTVDTSGDGRMGSENERNRRRFLGVAATGSSDLIGRPV